MLFGPAVKGVTREELYLDWSQCNFTLLCIKVLWIYQRGFSSSLLFCGWRGRAIKDEWPETSVKAVHYPFDGKSCTYIYTILNTRIIKEIVIINFGPNVHIKLSGVLLCRGIPFDRSSLCSGCWEQVISIRFYERYVFEMVLRYFGNAGEEWWNFTLVWSIMLAIECVDAELNTNFLVKHQKEFSFWFTSDIYRHFSHASLSVHPKINVTALFGNLFISTNNKCSRSSFPPWQTNRKGSIMMSSSSNATSERIFVISPPPQQQRNLFHFHIYYDGLISRPDVVQYLFWQTWNYVLNKLKEGRGFLIERLRLIKVT